MNETTPNRRLAELEEERRLNPSPQISLQLAEEYRRQDRLADALELLEEEAKRHPGYLSAQVALGRLRLQAGHLEDALYSFEQVVAKDPTHLVANRYLVELYLDVGEEQKARDRLDLYRLLNSGDPEIEILEARFVVQEGEGTEPDDEIAEPVDEVRDTPAIAEHISSEEGPEGLEEASFQWIQPTAVALERFGGSAQPESNDGREEEIFAGVWRGLDRESYWDYLDSEEIFLIAAQRPPEATESTVEEPTATLGALYLEQGHWLEAERIFSSLLEEDPRSEGAWRGLHAARQGSGQPLSARYLLAGAGTLKGLSSAQRRSLMLQRYLERLRGRDMEARH